MPKRHANSRRRQQGSSLTKSAPETKVWSLPSQPMPEFNNTLKKDNNVHRFIQTLDFGSVFTTSTTLPTFYARSFTFNDIQQVSSFTSLFDQYNIEELEVWLVPQQSSTVATNNPTWYSVVDYDDAATPSALGSLQQYTNVITTPLSNGHYIRFRPHVAQSLYSGAFTSFGNMKAPWIDSGSPSVQHYGIKVGVNVTPSTININLLVRIHFRTRNVF